MCVLIVHGLGALLSAVIVVIHLLGSLVVFRRMLVVSCAHFPAVLVLWAVDRLDLVPPLILGCTLMVIFVSSRFRHSAFQYLVVVNPTW